MADRQHELIHLYGYTGAQHYDALDNLPEHEAKQLNAQLNQLELSIYALLLKAQTLGMAEVLEGTISAILSEQSEAAYDDSGETKENANG